MFFTKYSNNLGIHKNNILLLSHEYKSAIFLHVGIEKYHEYKTGLLSIFSFINSFT